MPRCKANVTFRKLPLRNKHSITRFVLEHTNFPLAVQTLKPMQGYVTQPCLPQLALKLGPHSLLQMQGGVKPVQNLCLVFPTADIGHAQHS